MTGEWQVLNRKAGDEYPVMVWLKPSQFLLSYATDESAWMSVGVAVDGFGKILRSEWTKLQFFILFFFWRETWCLLFTKEHWSKVFYKRIVAIMFRAKDNGVTGEWLKLHNDKPEPHKLLRTHARVLVCRQLHTIECRLFDLFLVSFLTPSC